MWSCWRCIAACFLRISITCLVRDNVKSSLSSAQRSRVGMAKQWSVHGGGSPPSGVQGQLLRYGNWGDEVPQKLKHFYEIDLMCVIIRDLAIAANLEFGALRLLSEQSSSCTIIFVSAVLLGLLCVTRLKIRYDWHTHVVDVVLIHLPLIIRPFGKFGFMQSWISLFCACYLWP